MVARLLVLSSLLLLLSFLRDKSEPDVNGEDLVEIGSGTGM